MGISCSSSIGGSASNMRVIQDATYRNEQAQEATTATDFIRRRVLLVQNSEFGMAAAEQKQR